MGHSQGAIVSTADTMAAQTKQLRTRTIPLAVTVTVSANARALVATQLTSECAAAIIWHCIVEERLRIQAQVN